MSERVEEFCSTIRTKVLSSTESIDLRVGVLACVSVPESVGRGKAYTQDWSMALDLCKRLTMRPPTVSKHVLGKTVSQNHRYQKTAKIWQISSPMRKAAQYFNTFVTLLVQHRP